MDPTGSGEHAGTPPERVTSTTTPPASPRRTTSSPTTSSGRPWLTLGRRLDTGQEHITEEEFPRDSAVCAPVPIEEPTGKDTFPTETEDVYLADSTEVDIVQVTVLGSGDDITEDLVPSDNPVTSLGKAKNELRRWVVGGVGALIALSMIISFILVLSRPSLAEFSERFLQLVVGGLVGLAGSVVGFLFGRDQL